MTNYDNIPQELKDLEQWVSANASNKVPMKSWEYGAASSTNPDTWSDFDTSFNSYKDGHYDYCGFVFAGNGYVGIDIDDGYDADGFISELASDIISKCKSYTEKSRSGRGFHIVLRGDLPFKGKNNQKGVEIYKSSRYFIMTGDVLIYKDISLNQKAIDYVVEKYFPLERENSLIDGLFDKDRVYSPIWEKVAENGKIRLEPTYPPITSGNRNLSLTSLAGAMHTQGYNKKQIYNKLVIVNQSVVSPPLADNELRNICNSVTRYKR